MVMEFITKRNTYGNRKYLYMDTEAKVWTRQCRGIIPEGIEIKSSDMKELIEKMKRNEYREV